jgi:hypothetical protein
MASATIELTMNVLKKEIVKLDSVWNKIKWKTENAYSNCVHVEHELEVHYRVSQIIGPYTL